MPASIWLDLEGRREGVYSTARTLCLNNRHSWGEVWFGWNESYDMTLMPREKWWISEWVSSSKSTWAGWDAADTSSALEKLENWLCKAVTKQKHHSHICKSSIDSSCLVFEEFHFNVLSLTDNFNISYACLFKIKNASVHTFAMKVAH